MNAFEEFLRSVREAMVSKAESQVVLPADLIDTAAAMSAKFYSAVPTASLYEYLQSAAEKEDYRLCILIQDEINRR